MKNFNIKKYFLLFMIYSIIGWISEVSLARLYLGKFINRGVLVGPYLPIYGVGCILIILFLAKFKDKPILLILFSMLLCSTLEYLTSFLLELAFNTRWWDYSNSFMNLHGRICLETTVLFGVAGSVVVYFVNPFFENVLEKLPNNVTNILFYISIIVLALDIAISYTSVILIRDSFDDKIKDTTEIVSKEAIAFIKRIVLNLKEVII